MYYIFLIFSHNLRLLRRNKLLFVILIFIYALIAYLQIRKQSDIFSYSASTFADASSFIPYMNVFFFSVFLLLPLIMIGTTLFHERKKVDTLDAIYYRRESNHEYIWGFSLATITLFLGFALVSLFVAICIHLFATEAPFQIGIYAFYLLTLLLPSIVFMLGLSLLVSSYCPHQALGQMLLWLYVFITLFYIQDMQHGLFDFLGITFPNVFSDFTGHPKITPYILQRGCYFFLGLGAIELSIIRFNRIPNNPGRVKEKVSALSFIIIGLALGTLFFTSENKIQSTRQAYSDTYNKYVSAPKATLLSQNIKYTPKNEFLTVNSELVIQNQSQTSLDYIILYLNPRLKIHSIKSGNTPLNHEREHQVIKIDKKLAVNDSLRLQINYEGDIDENICYLDFPERVTSNTRNRVNLACRYGQRYAFLEKDYTLLIPEVLWYPTTVPPVNPSYPANLEINFTRFTLQVDSPPKSKVISQGTRSFRGKYTIFTNKTPLPGISLCIGDYDTFRYMYDSVQYEANILRKHTYLTKDVIKDRKLKMAKVIPTLKQITETRLGKKYPFPQFVLTETPSSFTSYYRNERNSSEYIQPGLVFCPERFFAFRGKPGKDINDQIVYGLDGFFSRNASTFFPFSWDNLLGQYITSISMMPYIEYLPNKNHTITSLFYNKTFHIRSREFPFINSLLNAILQDNNSTAVDGRRIFMQEQETSAINYLKTQSLQDALLDSHVNIDVLECMMTLKSRELIDYFNVREVDIHTLVNFIMEFQNEYEFQQIDFDVFNRAFEDRFHLNLDKILKQWVSKNQIPRYLIKDFSSHYVMNMNPVMLKSFFTIFNDSDTDGIIHFEVSSRINSMSQGFDFTRARIDKNFDDRYYSYEIKAHTGKQFAFSFKKAESITMSTNISHNWPNRFSPSNGRVEGVDTVSYIKPVSKKYFRPDSNEIIVDNEDPNCVITHQNSKLSCFFHQSDDFFEYYSLIFPTDRWKKIFDQDCYGAYTRSYLYKKAGNGKANVEWSTQLQRQGKYEILVFLPMNRFFSTEKVNQQKYIIRDEKEEKIVYINGPTWKEGWTSLGTFSCPKGKCSIILSDEGIAGQVIIGDAVKWTYVDN